MNGKDLLTKLAEILSPKKEDVKLAYAKLEDGTIITATEFVVDQPVEIVNEDGTKSPVEDGDYKVKIEDKEFDVKVVDGKISEMVEVPMEVLPEEVPVEEVPVETPEVEVEVEQPETEVPTEEPVMDEKDMKIAELEAKIKELEAKLAGNMEKEETELSLQEDEVELPKLDGAPVEQKTDLNIKLNKNNSPENRFLSRLYGDK